MSMRSAELYQPLDVARDEVRFLTIDLPQNDSSIISCRLHTASLSVDPSPNFIALSYVWGDPGVTENILVNDQVFAATTNLVSALRQISILMRRTTSAESPRSSAAESTSASRALFSGLASCPSDFPFWIDAICINQADSAERSSQVQLMGKLYRSASKVLAWLGNQGADMELVLKDLREVSSQWRLPGNDYLAVWKYMDSHPATEIFSNLDTASKIWQPHAGNPLQFDPRWVKICKIFELPYWRRLWIRQEIFLSKELFLLLGSECVLWDDISRFWAQMLHCSRSRHVPAGLRNGMWYFLLDYCQEVFNKVCLLSMRRSTIAVNGHDTFTDFSDCRASATNAHDHVYGVLGFLPFRINVDYNAPVRDVFVEFVSNCLQLDRRDALFHDLMHRSGVGTVYRSLCQHNLPSWIEDFSRGNITTTGTMMNARKDLFGDVTATISPSGILNTPGVKCGSIAHIQLPTQEALLREPENTNRYLDYLSYLVEVVDYYGEKTIHGVGSPLEAIIRVLFDDEVACEGARMAIDQEATIVSVLSFIYDICFFPTDSWDAGRLQSLRLDSGPGFINTLKSGVPRLMSVTPRAWRDDMNASEVLGQVLNTELGSRIMSWQTGLFRKKEISNYRFFHTEDGKLGLGPPGMEVTDSIHVLPVSKEPLVFRQRPGDSMLYVGPAFVLGLSHGEVAAMVEDRTVDVEDLRIM